MDFGCDWNHVILRTVADFKLGIDLFRGSTSFKFYRGSFIQIAAQRP